MISSESDFISVEEQSEFNFLSAEERLLMDIDAEVSKTLSSEFIIIIAIIIVIMIIIIVR